MKKLLKIVGAIAIIALVGAIGFSIVAFAQGGTSTPGAAKSVLPWLGGLIGGKGDGALNGYSEQYMNALAGKLGVDRAKLDQAIKDAQKEVIDQAVKDGKITQEQANWLLDPQAAMKAQIEQAVKDGKLTQEQADWLLQGIEKGYMPYGRGGMMGGRGGMMGGRGGMMRGRGGWEGQPGNTGKVTPTPAPSGTKGQV